MIVKLLTDYHLEFLSLKGGCRGSSESTLVKISNCWKSHAAAQFYNTALEVVESFKYLGVTLFKNGNWNRSQKCIAKHASFALYNAFTILNNIELPISQNNHYLTH